jgi:hypothetical protein
LPERYEGGFGMASYPHYQPGWHESFNSTFVPYVGMVSNGDILMSTSGLGARLFVTALANEEFRKSFENALSYDGEYYSEFISIVFQIVCLP